MIYFYRSQPIFSFPLDWSDGAIVRASYTLPVRQIGFGESHLEPEQNHLALGFELQVDLNGVADVRALEAFHQRVRGRLRGFWLPSPDWAFSPLQVIDSTHFDVVATGFAAAWDLHPCRHLWLTDTNGEAAAVRITGVTSPAPGVERIATEEVLPAGFDPATWAVARLHFVRMERDELEVVYLSPSAAAAQIRCYELPLEYAEGQLGDRPVWLYEFREQAIAGVQQTWRFTSHDVPIVALGFTWAPAPFAHGALTETVRGDQDELALESFKFDGNPLLVFFPFAPQRRLYCTLRSMRIDDGVIGIRFSGEVRQAEAEGRVLRARVATRLDAEDRQIPRLIIGRNCSYQLGDAGCGVNLASPSYSNTGPISAIASNQITWPAGAVRAAQFFNGGHCVVTGGTTGREIRAILTSNGATLTLNAPFATATAGMQMTAYAGCDKRYASAGGCPKFGNQANFGGHPFIERNLALKAVKVKERQPGGGKK